MVGEGAVAGELQDHDERERRRRRDRGFDADADPGIGRHHLLDRAVQAERHRQPQPDDGQRADLNGQHHHRDHRDGQGDELRDD